MGTPRQTLSPGFKPHPCLASEESWKDPLGLGINCLILMATHFLQIPPQCLQNSATSSCFPGSPRKINEGWGTSPRVSACLPYMNQSHCQDHKNRRGKLQRRSIHKQRSSCALHLNDNAEISGASLLGFLQKTSGWKPCCTPWTHSLSGWL